MRIVKVEVRNKKDKKEIIYINVEMIAAIEVKNVNFGGYGWVVDIYLNNKMYNAYEDYYNNPIRIPVKSEEDGKEFVEKIFETKEIFSMGVFEK